MLPLPLFWLEMKYFRLFFFHFILAGLQSFLLGIFGLGMLLPFLFWWVSFSSC
jgi:hypothetical protein